MEDSMYSEDKISVDRNASCSMQEDENDGSCSTIDLVSDSESDDGLEGSSSKHQDDEDEYIDMSDSEPEETPNYCSEDYRPNYSYSIDSETDSSFVDVPLDPRIIIVPQDGSIVDVPQDRGIVDVPQDCGIVDVPQDSSIVDVPRESNNVDVLQESSIVDDPQDSSIVEVPLNSSNADDQVDSSKSYDPLDNSRSYDPLDSSRSYDPLDNSRSYDPLDNSRSYDPLDSSRPDDPLDSSKPDDPLDSSIIEVPLDTSQQSVRSAQFENSISSANNTKSFKYNSSSSNVLLAEDRSGTENNSALSGNCSCISAHCVHSRKRAVEKRRSRVTFKLPPKKEYQNKENYPKSANEMGLDGAVDNLMSFNGENDASIEEISVETAKVYDPREFASRRILTATRRTGTSKSHSPKKKVLATSPCCSTGYEENHLHYLRERERLMPPLYRQSPQMSERPRLVELIKGVCSARCLSFTTTQLAVTLLDRFMDAHDIKHNQLNLAAMSALLLAAKYEECDENIPRILRLNEYCEHDQYMVTHFYTMEAFMLDFFDWHLGYITPAMFAEMFFLRAIQSSDSMELPDKFSEEFDDKSLLARPRPDNPPVLDRIGGIKNLVFDQMPRRVASPSLACTSDEPPAKRASPMRDEDDRFNNNPVTGLEQVSASLASQPPRVTNDTYDTSTSSGGSSSSSYETISSYASVSPGGGRDVTTTDTANNNKKRSWSQAEAQDAITAIEQKLGCNFSVSDVHAPVASSSRMDDNSNCIHGDSQSSSSSFVDASSRSVISHTAPSPERVPAAMLSPHVGEGDGEDRSSNSSSSSDRTTSTPSVSSRGAPFLPMSPVTTQRVVSPSVNLRVLTQELWGEVKENLNLAMDRPALMDAMPSEVAAACLLLARRSLSFRPLWPSSMRRLTFYTEQQLQRTCGIITGSGDGAMFPNTPDSGYRSNAATPAASPGEPSPATPAANGTKGTSGKEH